MCVRSSVAAALLLSSCAIHPVPEDVTGVNTYHIVRQIRCETREAAAKFVLNEIDGIAVSDFLYPSFFESWHKARSVQFDHLKKVDRPFQTLPNGYQIVSDGKSTREIFGSRPKERNFREVEIRTMHRSEHRKQIARHAAISRAMRSDSDLGASRAALLHHAGQFLTALAAVMDAPLPDAPFELARRGRRGGVVDPLPGDPFEL